MQPLITYIIWLSIEYTKTHKLLKKNRNNIFKSSIHILDLNI